jgi:murein DD-endopeptidase MepM/ murein hydrolase activator NlpD
MAARSRRRPIVWIAALLASGLMLLHPSGWTTAVDEMDYVYPVPGGAHSRSHLDYPAADIFKSCWAMVVAPADGRIVHLRRIDYWKPRVDNPATRGGISIAIVDEQGVRHYLAHLARIRGDLVKGDRVAAGQRLGRMGRTGRAGACHTHYGLSPTCPNVEWWVRRGVIWPQRFLPDWRSGIMTSPHRAIRKWLDAHPDACHDPDNIGATADIATD